MAWTTRDRSKEANRYGAGWGKLGLERKRKVIEAGERVPEYDDPVAKLMGDPVPGRSALDRRKTKDDDVVEKFRLDWSGVTKFGGGHDDGDATDADDA